MKRDILDPSIVRINVERDRIDKLLNNMIYSYFYTDEQLDRESKVMRKLIIEQRDIMEQYKKVLEERIKLLLEEELI